MPSRLRHMSRRALPSSTTARATRYRWTRSNVSIFKALHHNCLGDMAELAADTFMRVQVGDVKLFFDCRRIETPSRRTGDTASADACRCATCQEGQRQAPARVWGAHRRQGGPAGMGYHWQSAAACRFLLPDFVPAQPVYPAGRFKRGIFSPALTHQLNLSPIMADVHHW